MEQPVGTGSWHPAQIVEVFRRQNDTVWHQLLTRIVNGAIAFFLVQVATHHSRIKNLTGIFVFKFMQAALCAAIAE